MWLYYIPRHYNRNRRNPTNQNKNEQNKRKKSTDYLKASLRYNWTNYLQSWALSVESEQKEFTGRKSSRERWYREIKVRDVTCLVHDDDTQPAICRPAV